jgi:hypothetical protein
MDRFASCYFCGAAVDASLSEYPVVPKELEPAEDGPTVVLCGTCRRKLGAVVEEVVGAATAQRNEPAETTATHSVEPTDAAGGALLDDGAADERESAARDTGGAATGPATGTETDGTTAASVASDDSASATNGDGAEPTLTKLEYSKVMRLLENRPFPVDRGEIREVAASAYDIDREEFDAVIEAAVSRDLLAVENGQFVEPT